MYKFTKKLSNNNYLKLPIILVGILIMFVLAGWGFKNSNVSQSNLTTLSNSKTTTFQETLKNNCQKKEATSMYTTGRNGELIPIGKTSYYVISLDNLPVRIDPELSKHFFEFKNNEFLCYNINSATISAILNYSSLKLQQAKEEGVPDYALFNDLIIYSHPDTKLKTDNAEPSLLKKLDNITFYIYISTPHYTQAKTMSFWVPEEITVKGVKTFTTTKGETLYALVSRNLLLSSEFHSLALNYGFIPEPQDTSVTEKDKKILRQILEKYLFDSSSTLGSEKTQIDYVQKVLSGISGK